MIARFDRNSKRLFSDGRSKDIKDLLDILANRETNVSDYGQALEKLGKKLAQSMCEKHSSMVDNNITLAVSAEDADHLANGFINQFEEISHKKVFLVCFWNNRTEVLETNKTIAPVAEEYLEPGFDKNSTLVVLKSIISSSCVVKSNILSLYGRMNPEKVYIAAPVVLKNADKRLKNEFPKSFSDMFSFQWFAEDKVREDDGTVIPGIGGQIYERLGISGKPHDVKLMPNSVMNRILNIA